MKLMSALLALALVPLMLVALVAYHTSRDILKANASAKLEELAAQTMDKLDRVLFASSQDLQAWASIDDMQDAASDDQDGRITLTLVRLWSQYGHYASIYCVNQLGMVVASSEVSFIGRTVEKERWFREGTRVAGLTVNDLAFDPLSGSLTTRLMVPITARHDDQVVIGYLVAHIMHDEVRDILRQVKVHDGEQNVTGHVVLANRTGGIIAGPPSMVELTPSPQFPKTTLTSLGYQAPNAATLASRGAYLTAKEQMLLGYAKSSGYRTFTGLGWTVFVAQNSTEAFGQIKMLRREFLALFLATTLLVVLVAVAMARGISTPIRSLTELANRVAAGDLTKTIVVDAQDEVGALASSFNRMTVDLRRSRDELVQTNQALVDARDHALEVSQLKSHFLANMSHEIRTPMNGVLGMTELLLATSLTERQRRLADTVYRSGSALLKIINDILDFSKIEAGKMELEHIDFDLRQVVEEAVDMFTEQAQRKGLELFCAIPADLPTAVQGDPGRLRQVLINLLGNAIKFTDRGEVGVRLAVQQDAPSHVVIRCTVSDTGIGIAPESQADVFEPFTQADGSSTRKYSGTGLGLSIVKQLISLMHGTIAVESTVGVGSQFVFSVQLEKQPVVETRHKTARSNLADRRVLIVDDNDTNRVILEEQVAGWRMRSTSVDSGPAALAALRTAAARGAPFDIALLDFQMPGMDGLQLGAEIAADPSIAAVKRVMLTSVGQPADGPTVAMAGILLLLTKPVRQSELYNGLLNLLAAETDAACKTDSSIPAPTISTARLPATTRYAARVLVAEDNAVNQEVARLMLEQLVCTADVVLTGREAIEAHYRAAYDLIFMDCQMPEMDGFEATRAIRTDESQHSEKPRVAIVALTAHAIAGDRDECLAAGMDDYLAKPFTQEQLAAVLARWLPSERLVASAASATATEPSAAAPAAEPAAAPARHSASTSLAHTPSGEEAMIDRKVWQDIAKLQQPGRPDVLVTMLSIFLKDSDELVERLRQAIERQDGTAVFELAHAFKSRSGVLGAVRLADLSKQIEHLGRTKDLAQTSALFASLVDEFMAVTECFRTEIQRRSAT